MPKEGLTLKSLLTSISSLRVVPGQTSFSLEALPHAVLSYAMAGEDVALTKMFKQKLKDRRPGVYVDIGAYSPILISNTYMFYCHEWTGVCVDPNLAMVSDWKEFRPRDTFLSAAVGEGDGLVYRHHKVNPGMSRLFGEDEPAGNDYGEAISIPVLRLDAILEKHIGQQQIDFMSIDVEGAELGVLRTNDWARWRPTAICMECFDFDLLRPRESAPVAYLMERGYTVHSKIWENVILTTGI